MKRTWRWLWVLLVAAALAACAQAAVSPSTPSATAIRQTRAAKTTTPVAESALDQVSARDLPPEVASTLALIAQGGPFPYDRDGVTFQNRERLLPRKPQGYYHEYTVPTPGEDDRGPRRIVTGEQGEIYYTADHYASFIEVVP